MKTMRRMGLMGLMLLAVAWLTGCAWYGHTGPSPDEMRSFAYNLSSDAGYVGAGIDLDKNPGHRAAYQVTVEALKALVSRTNFDALALSQALKNLPSDTLAGSQGALIIEGSVSLWSVVTAGWIKLDGPPMLLAVAQGTLAGIQRALDRQATTAMGVRRPAAKTQTVWPVQCIPPKQKAESRKQKS